MRRKGQPNLPKAIICCCLSSLNTLFMRCRLACPATSSTSRTTSSMAGFEVTLHAEFWVTAEAYVVEIWEVQALLDIDFPSPRFTAVLDVLPISGRNI